MLSVHWQTWLIKQMMNMKKNNIEHVITYLEACHALFEKGLLSHMKIKCPNSLAIRNVKKGFKYFEDWCRAYENAGKSFYIYSTLMTEFSIV